MARKCIFVQRRLHHPAQPHKSPSHVRHSCDDPNPRPRCQPDHRSKFSSTMRSASPSTLPEMQTCPLGNSTWIVPAVGTATCRRSDRFTLLACTSLTCTGSNLTGSAFLSLSRPWRYCRRQVNTWLAFTPCASATLATDAPGLKVCSTIRHFSPAGHRRLCGSLLTTARSEVSIYSPSGHFRRCPLRAIFHIDPLFVQMYWPNAYRLCTDGSDFSRLDCVPLRASQA